MKTYLEYKLFPKLEDVFVDSTPQHEAVFFPLLTIDLKSINKGEGKVHFVCYFRNGEDTIINDPNLGYNFIRFKIIGDKYQFNGNFNEIYLFEKSIKWYEEAKEIYKEHKEKYLSNSDFVEQEDAKRKEINFEYYYYIQGVLNYWITRDKYIETGKFIQGSAYTYGNSNQEREIFTDFDAYDDEGYPDEILEETLTELKLNLDTLDYIGSLKGYNYLDLGADETVLFVNEKLKEALIYYNWS